MAMALRTMAAKLKQKIPSAVQRVFASSRAPAPASTLDAGLDDLGPEFRRTLEKIVELNRKRRRDEALARGAGFGLAMLTLSLGIRRVK